jgi:BirA family transcriptional regulator, biotin operon repressor / biotin---[acetyl-CoA-carboxylase] ligase
VADAQTGGRGRHGRSWVSPIGNLYASLMLVDPSLLPRAPELGFVAGVALVRTLRDILGGDARLCLKWPNDIVHDGAKLAGILLESVSLGDGHFACVIGIGVNCRSHPQSLPYEATDLAEIGALLAAPEDLFPRLSAEFADWLDVWANGQAFEPIREQWLSHAAGLGTLIKISNPQNDIEGVFRTIDGAGRLVLETLGGVVAIEAGDVFLAPRPKGALAALESRS